MSDIQARKIVARAFNKISGGKVNSFEWVSTLNQALTVVTSTKLKKDIETSKNLIHSNQQEAFWYASRIVSGK